MSIYFAPTNFNDNDDPAVYCRQLELKLHYVMSCLDKAGILLDANGKPTFVSESIQADSDQVQTTVQGNQ